MTNLDLYNAVRAVPEGAQKIIAAGRLKGFTDINPMWRIKMLTERFGPCGIGWKYEITEKRFEHGANDEIVVFVDVNLYVKWDGAWSEAIPGTGGSMLVAKERSGLYTSDECVKMALTDALSVACKALGFGADVYWGNDKSKYDAKPTVKPLICEQCGGEIKGVKKGDQIIPAEEIAKSAKETYGKALCLHCMREANTSKNEGDPSAAGF